MISARNKNYHGITPLTSCWTINSTHLHLSLTPLRRTSNKEDGLAYVHMRKVLVCSHAHNLMCDQSIHTAPIPYHLRGKVPDNTFGLHSQDGQPEMMFGAENGCGQVCRNMCHISRESATVHAGPDRFVRAPS
jgi:hypothetical protein